MTDESGAVSTDGAGADHYNVKWDGVTLTLKDAVIREGHRVIEPPKEAFAAVYSPGPLQLALEGENTAAIPGEDTTTYGVYADSGLTLSGGGSLAITSSRTGVYIESGGLTITGGKLTTAARPAMASL